MSRSFGLAEVRPRSRHLLTLSLSTILASGLAFPAFAQTEAPERLNVDGNGVDLSDGSFNFVHRDVSIGPDGPGGLEYTRIHGRSGLFDNYQGFVSVRTGGTPVFVTIGNKSEAFDLSGGVYVSRGTGSTLSNSGTIWTYRQANGTEYQLFINEPEPGNRLKGLQSIKFPTGEKIELTWVTRSINVPGCTIRPCATRTFQRLSSINNNSGYQLKLEYAGNSIGSTNEQWGTVTKIHAINNKIDYCSPTAAVCTGLTQAWPFASYSRTMGASETTYQVVNDRGQTWTYSGPNYSTLITAIKRPAASASTTVATFTGAKVTTLTREGASWSYSYVDDGAGGRTTTVTDPLNRSKIIKTVIADGRVTSQKDELNQETVFTYDSVGRLQETTSPEGNKTIFGYDNRGNVTTKTFRAKPGAGGADIVLQSNFPGSCANILTCNKPEWTKDAKLNQTDYTYDSSSGMIATITLPASSAGGVRPQTRFSYQALQANYKNSSGAVVASGQPIYKLTAMAQCQTSSACIGAADETKTTIAYDSNLLPSSISSGAGDGSLTTTSIATYTGVGDVATVDGPLAGSDDTKTHRYGPGRLPAGVISADPDGSGPLKRRAEKITYNADGELATSEVGTVDGLSDADWAGFAPAERVVTTFDGAGRKATEALIGGGVTYQLTEFSHDAVGRVECAAVRVNSLTSGSLPACTPGGIGTAASDRVTKNTYDEVGRLRLVQTAFGTADQSDEVINTFTGNGKLASVIDAEGNKTSYEYDGFDRLSITRYPVTTVAAGASSTIDYEQLGYDAASNVTSRRLRDGQTITYGYDNLNRLTSKATPGSVRGDWDISYNYDLLGRLTSATGDGAMVNSFTYDALGRLLTEQNYNATTHHAYDLAGRQTRLTWNDGFYVDYDYNVTGEMTTIRENGASSGAGVLAIYLYDNLGRRASVTRGNGTTTNYSYDAVSRLATLSQDLAGSAYDFTHSFSYNPAGQIASLTRSNDTYAWGGHYNVDRNYGINGLNQTTTAGTTSLGYDGRGNLTNSGAAGYNYTTEDRLETAPSARLLYEPAGGQILQLYNSSTGQDGRFAWSGSQMIAELNGYGLAITKRYVPGPGTDEPVVWYEGSGTSDRRWLHADERGSVVAVSDGSGNAISINRYDEYGIPASTNDGRFQYTGQAWMPELGMYYYKARMYSPTLGRFMQTDPIGYGDGMNLYNYVGSDPVNSADSTGLATCSVNVPNTVYGYYYGSWWNLGPSPIPSESHTVYYECGNSGGSGSGSGPGYYGGGAGGAPAPAPALQKQHLTCDGEPGFAPFQEAAVSAMAQNPPNSYTPAWLRGIFIHSAFSRAAAAIPGTSFNISYRDGLVTGWLTPGSSRPDAIYGDINRPSFIIELKTSGARLVGAQLTNYLKNLPKTTKVCEIYEGL